MSKSLYRKYRSQSLDDIVGQKGVVKALKNAIAKNAISHAYLFTGPRGVGKTSIARILAFAIVDKPYNLENLPIDIIEIDAASNRGIDEVRDLRDKARIAPVESKYKVYIIDEVHMLTSHAFNALLKTLEEPPEHIVFILATTESHKLPETIVSRTQKYNFNLATAEEVTEHLADISKKEKIDIDRESLELIAQHSGGSLRDAISTLDHARHLNEHITANDIRINIGIPSDDIVDSILNSIAGNDASRLLKDLEMAEQDNITPVTLANHLIIKLKKDLKKQKPKLPIAKTVSLMKELSALESKTQAETHLFVTLLGAINHPANDAAVQPPASTSLSTKQDHQPEPIAPPTIKPKDNQYAKETVVKTPLISPPETTDTAKAAIAKQKVKSIAKPVDNNVPNLTQEVNETTAEYSNQKLTTPDKNGASIDESTWQMVLEDVRSTHNTLYSVLRMAKIDLSEVSNYKINLNMQFPFHHKRVSESKNKIVITEKLQKFGIEGYEIICNLAKPEKSLVDEDTVDDDNLTAQNDELALNKIRGIFGSAEPF